MKAFEIRSPGDYGVTEAPEPVIGEEEVLVQVAYAAICHSDIDMLTGARRHLIRYPNIGGHEFAGTVVRAGHRVKGFRPGDRVACECIIRCGQCTGCDLGWNDCENYSELGFMQGGGFAEYCAVPARNCHRIADHVSFEQAALTEPLGNGFAVAEAAGIGPRDRVAVIGPGPIGLYAMQCAKLWHPRQLIMIGTREERLKYAAGTADVLINIREQDAAKAVMAATGGEGVQVVLMCATTVSACELALQISGGGCRVIVEGLPGETPVPVCFNDFVVKSLTIKGVAGVTAKQFRQVITLMENGVLDPAGLVTHRFPLTRITEGFEILQARNQDAVKILVDPSAQDA